MSSLKVTEKVDQPIEGFFKLETIDSDGNVIDTFEQKNMIMKRSKASAANAVMGSSPHEHFINKIVFGDGGHDNGNLLVGQGFAYEKSSLFSEVDGSGETFTLLFDPQARTGQGDTVLIKELKTGVITTTNQQSTVKINIINVSTNQYVFDISPGSANADTGTGVKPWTEAALYTKNGDSFDYLNEVMGDKGLNGQIFAMRTFPAKIKDNSTTFRVTWEIVF